MAGRTDRLLAWASNLPAMPIDALRGDFDGMRMCFCARRESVGSMMRESPEVLFDGQTVWVNSPDGCCIGRFGRRGMDVHHDAADQMRLGKQCKACTHTKPGLAEWSLFKRHMLAAGVFVPDDAMPAWCG